MDVRSALDKSPNEATAISAEQELSGWLVIIDNELYLLEENLCEDYKQSLKIKLSDRNIIYAIRQKILPLGGGESFVFHKAKVTGFLQFGVSPEIVARSLYIQERGHDDMIAIDITQNAICNGKKQYEAALKFDFFKEMGDR